MKSQYLAAALTLALAVPASARLTGSYQDFGNRLSKASNAAVGNQFLSMPLPMANVLKGKWQLGVDGGYSAVDAGVVQMKGGMTSVGYTYGFADHWGVYSLAYGNSQSISGGGREAIVHPFATGVPLDTPEYAEHTNVRGTAKLMGGGAAVVWDPLLSGEDSHSLPLYAGLLVSRFSLDNATVDYRMLTGADAGQTGSMNLSGDYTFVSPILGIQYARNIGQFKITPHALFIAPMDQIAQKGTITGTAPKVFNRSGDTGMTSVTDAGYQFFVIALGTNVIYRPWGLGANIGATLFKAAVGSTLYDGVAKVIQFDLSWRWGRYAK